MFSLLIVATCSTLYEDIAQSLQQLITSDPISITLGTQESREETFSSGYYKIDMGTQSELTIEATELSIIEAILANQVTLRVKGPVIIAVLGGIQSTIEIIATDDACPLILYNANVQSSLSLTPDSFISGTFAFGLTTRALQDDFKVSNTYVSGKFLSQPTGEFKILTYDYPQIDEDFKLAIKSLSALLGQSGDSEMVFVEYSSKLGMIIGIVVAVVVVIVAIIVGIFIYRHIKAKKNNEAPAV